MCTDMQSLRIDDVPVSDGTDGDPFSACLSFDVSDAINTIDQWYGIERVSRMTSRWLILKDKQSAWCYLHQC